MQQAKSNPWKIIVLTTIGMVVAVLLVRFLFAASSDLQAAVIFSGFGILAGHAIGFFNGLNTRMKGEPVDHQQELQDAYTEGRKAGRYEGYRAAIAQDGVCEVIVPQQQRELVPVRR